MPGTLATILTVLWLGCSAGAAVFYARVGLAMVRRMKLVRNAGSRLIGGDYVWSSAVGLLICVLFILAAVLSPLAANTANTIVIAKALLAVVSMLLIAHSIRLWRRLYIIGPRQ